MCTLDAISPSPEASSDFADRLVYALNEAAVLGMISMGHRTGLFDTLARLGPATSVQLARVAGLDERYVREWLHGLFVGRVIERSPDGVFSLPAEHAAVLTRSAPENMALYAQYIAQLGSVEDQVVACFQTGGGVPYSAFERFHEIMAEDSGQAVVPALMDHILPLCDGLIERLEHGIDVADLGCGRGLALIAMARRFPSSRFLGVDLSEDAIAFATATSQGVDNVRFELRDLSDFDRTAPEQAFDLITTFDAVHDQPDPSVLLRGIRRALRPDGVYLMQDIHASTDPAGNLDHPMGPLLYGISLSHCMTVSLAQGGIGLGTMWGREAAERLITDAGFGAFEVHQLEHDIQNDYWVIGGAA